MFTSIVSCLICPPNTSAVIDPKKPYEVSSSSSEFPTLGANGVSSIIDDLSSGLFCLKPSAKKHRVSVLGTQVVKVVPCMDKSGMDKPETVSTNSLRVRQSGLFPPEIENMSASSVSGVPAFRLHQEVLGRCYRVLVADDSKLSRRMLRHLAEELGFSHIEMAENADVAISFLNRAEREGTPFHAVFSDRDMGNVTDGDALALYVASLGYPVHFVMVSSTLPEVLPVGVHLGISKGDKEATEKVYHYFMSQTFACELA